MGCLEINITKSAFRRTTKFDFRLFIAILMSSIVSKLGQLFTEAFRENCSKLLKGTK